VYEALAAAGVAAVAAAAAATNATAADDTRATDTGRDFERVLADASPATAGWLREHATPNMRRHGHPAGRWNEQMPEDSIAAMSAAEKWRHSVYAYGVLALVAAEFNGNKEGAVGEYPSRARQVVRELGGGAYMYGPISRTGSSKDYQGHNIAAMAVAPTGHVVGSAFNHNVLFSSTTQHAEQRLIDDLFSRPDALVPWAGGSGAVPSREVNTEEAMRELAVYTSLEPCQQCAGKLHLAGIPEVMYCQRDWDIELHLTAMYRRHFKTRPIPGWAVGFRPSTDLTLAFLRYRKAVEADRLVPFFRSVTGAVTYAKTTMPYFLCTDAAKDVFDAAASTLAGLMTPDDAEWAALPPAARDAIATYRPGADLRQRRVKEDELASRRRELTSFDYDRRCTVYIGSELPPGGNEEGVEAALAPYGDIASVHILRDAATGNPRGPVFVQFASPRDAAAAAAAIHGRAMPPWRADTTLTANVSTYEPRYQRALARISQLEAELAAPPAPPAPGTLTNAEVLAHVRAYVQYERLVERRSTMRT